MSPTLHEVPVAILAGGLATRLGAVAAQKPKALVEVAGRPFVDHQLALLQRRGVRRVVLLVGHLGDEIERHVGDGRRFGLQARVLHDGPELLGTGGALRRAAALLGPLFFVLYGDSLADVDYAALLRALPEEAEGLMTVLRNEGRWDASNVVFEGGRLLRYDKRARVPEMRHVDYGVGLLRARALERLPAAGPSDLAELYTALAAEGRLQGFEVYQRFYEIGSPSGLAETRRHVEEQQRMSYVDDYLSEAVRVAQQIDRAAVERLVEALVAVRERGGRLFVLGVGGSAANASHAVNDFRKICGIETYAPTDNVSELTARTNDEGWAGVFDSWLRVSRLCSRDTLLVFSVGGGNLEQNVSPNLVAALQYAKSVGARITGIVGRDGGFTARAADACVVVPVVNPTHVTPHSEAFQAVVWHLFVSHPLLKQAQTKWESVK